MVVSSVAENVFGTLGTVCWTIQLIPQIWKTYRSKSAEGLSPLFVFLWAVSGPFLGVYVIVQNLNIPLILQPQLFSALSLVSWCQCLYYNRKCSRTVCIMLFVAVAAIMAGFQTGMVFAVRSVYHDGTGNDAALRFFGIFSAVIIALALLPQYYEIYKHREVIGISTMFMAIDLLGGVFSDLSLVFKSNFDVIAGVTYSVVIVMDGLVIISALILNPRAHRRRMYESTIASESATNSTPAMIETASGASRYTGATPREV
ncbi:hypothetical protein SERLA73DRAFT_191748 [Serpula lacrymans var. lacrymans S7.3]|uniref:PQ-loop-domain-containing protein n=2 Tax=Serpula lacrymans var. lacrymans TaxID=341189 RepID=F8QI75_SERL3|nr:uncharacterized protein SERLADRAFT_472765 [Serpula lacrymans var. lacrymans S7.9]EGN91977.1 hypothetical protein SERLA73DRAFT_191748 [Serpula lacrymans var. lacrymans S7.3]EGO22230.1 hypothetical protein SERLADRAFT_472765 [Serpula lacrymans var. lacrymans S7.9]